MSTALRYTFFFAFIVSLMPRASALSVGDIQANSTVGQPLEAVITVEDRRAIAVDQLLVSLAPRSVYDRMGVYWEYFHSNLNFELEQVGAKRVLIRVTTKQNLIEPYINFVLSVRWPDGLVTKEYMLLLEMQQVVTGGGISAVANTADIEDSEVTSSESANQVDPAVAQEVEANDAPEILVAPNLTVQPSAVAPQSTGPGIGNSERQWRIQTRSGDTLWGIAKKVGSDSGVTISSAMSALYENNRNAFGSSANQMRAGAILDVTLSQLRAASPLTLRTKPQAAKQERDIESPATVPPAESVAARPTPPAAQDEETGGVLSVVTEQEEPILTSTAPDSGSGSSADEKLATVGLSQAERELDEARLKAEAIEARLNSLMAQYEVLNEKTEKLKELEIELNRRIAEKAAAGIEPENPATALSVPSIGTPTPSEGFFAKNRWLLVTVLGLILIGLAILALTRVGRMVPADRELSDDDAQPNEDWDETAFLNEKELDDTELAEIVKLKGERAYVENQVIDDDSELLGEEAGNGIELQAAMFIAYERYDEAEELINETLLENPDNTPLKLQLLEIFAARKDRMQFGMLANRLRELNDEQINATIDALAQF